MNISAKKIEKCTGEARDDRPDYVNDLTLKRKIGWQKGSPVVGDRVGLGDDLSQGYEHYRRRDELFQPDAGKFLSELFDCELINSVSDVSRELNSEVETVKKAANLHCIELSDGSDDSPEQERDNDRFIFPSGESWPTELLADPIESDVRVLSQLLATNGMSVEEVAQYLSDRLSRNVTASDVRQEAQRVNIL